VLADDPDDLPTAALALLVAPAVVFSDDPDLVDNGFAGQAWWTEAAGDVLIVAEADGQLVSVLAGVSLTTVGTGYGTAAVVRAARRAPVVTITVAVAVLAGVYLLVRRSPPGRVRAALKELGAFAVTTWRDVTDRQRAGAARLSWVEVPAGRTPFLEERCARILARATGTLSADELHEQLYHDLIGLCQVGARGRPLRRSHRGAGRWHTGQAPAQQASRTCSCSSSCHKLRPTPPVLGDAAAPGSKSRARPRPGSRGGASQARSAPRSGPARARLCTRDNPAPPATATWPAGPAPRSGWPRAGWPASTARI
jgi:hypothetical protein